MSRLRLLGLGFAATVLVALAGCGPRAGVHPETARATAVVTLNGAPFQGATVMFHPFDKDGIGATGTTGADGRAAMMTFEAGDGAIPGKYRVTVSKSEGGLTPGTMNMEEYGQMMKKVNPGKPGTGTKQLLPRKYLQAATSGFEADVAKGADNTFTFPLTDGK